MKFINISNLPRAFLYHLICLANSKASRESYVKSKALFLCHENVDFVLIEIDQKNNYVNFSLLYVKYSIHYVYNN